MIWRVLHESKRIIYLEQFLYGMKVVQVITITSIAVEPPGYRD